MAFPEEFEARLSSLQRALNVILEYGADPLARSTAERWCNSYCQVAHADAPVALARDAVWESPQLIWFFLSTVERQAKSQYWTLSPAQRLQMCQDVQGLLHVCQAREQRLRHKLYSLSTTLLCWCAGNGDEYAKDTLQRLTTVQAPAEQWLSGDSVELRLQLTQVVVLLEDLVEHVLPSEARCMGVVPSSCMEHLRDFYFSSLQQPAVHLAITAVRTSRHRGTLHMGLSLLATVLRTVNMANQLPVTARELLQAVLPQLQCGDDDDLQHTAADALAAICAMPMDSSSRGEVQQTLFQLLTVMHAQAVPVSAESRASVVRAAIEGTKLYPHTLVAGSSAEAELQNVLRTSISAALGAQTPLLQLAALEPWAVWFGRVLDSMDDLFGAPETVAAVEARLRPYLQAAPDMLRTVLPCLFLQPEAPASAATCAAQLSLLEHSGHALEGELALLKWNDAAHEAAAELVVEDSGRRAAAGDKLLEALESSEHAVYCQHLEGIIAPVACAGGPATVQMVLQAVSHALQHMETAMLAGRDMQLPAMDVHVACNIASRCSSQPKCISVGDGLQFMSTWAAWMTRFASHVATQSPQPSTTQLLAGGAVLRLVSAWSALWLSDTVASFSGDLPAHVTQVLTSLFAACVAMLSAALDVIFKPQAPAYAQTFASNSGLALFTVTKLAINQPCNDPRFLLELRASPAAQKLPELANRTAVCLPPEPLQAGFVHNVWGAALGTHTSWLGQCKGVSASDWNTAAQDLVIKHACILTAWQQLAQRGAAGSELYARLQALSVALVGACRAVTRQAEQRCLFAWVQPVLVEVVRFVTPAAQPQDAQAVESVLKALEAATSGLLPLMEETFVQEIITKCVQLVSDGGGADVQDHLANLIWGIADKPSAKVVPILVDAVRYLLNYVQALLQPSQERNWERSRYAGGALRTTLHVMGTQGHAIQKAHPDMQTVPVQLAQQLASFLEGAAAATVPSGSVTSIQDLLEEYFDMQRVLGLYKTDVVHVFRLRLMHVLVMVLLNPAWDGAREPVLDILWGLGDMEWPEFVTNCLPGVLREQCTMVQQQTSMLVEPFQDDSASLHNFEHFSTVLLNFVNDVRFFSKVAAEAESLPVAGQLPNL